MIGYYVHHQGRGHLHRALAIERATELPITGLSTLRRPAGWAGPWVSLPDDATPAAQGDSTVGGWLHYAPDQHANLRARMARLSAWIQRHRPIAAVVDVSVEVALLFRLHGVPVISMAQPGSRTDRVHTLGYGISDAVIAPWPASVGPRLWRAAVEPGLVHPVGAISRFDRAVVGEPGSRRVVVLNGAGGGALSTEISLASRATPDWEWAVLDPAAGTWADDPWPLLCGATVIVSHCGQNAIAEIAAARRPAVLIPQPRPFAEQHWMAAALRSGTWPAEVLTRWPQPQEWPDILNRAAGLEGETWTRWNDGRGATRVGQLLEAVVGTLAVPA